MTSIPPPRIIQDILLDMQRLTPSLEKRRRRYNIGVFLGVLMIVVMLYTLLEIANNHAGTGSQIAVILIAFLPSFLLYKVVNKIYGKAIHKAFVDVVCLRGALTYSNLGFFEAREVDNHRILPDSSKSASGEGIKGTYRDVTFTLQEVSLKGRNGTTAFWGVVARIYLSYAFEAHTVILPRKALTPAARLRFPHWHQVNLPKKYEPLYEGLTTDTVEARAVAPMAFVERLMEAGQLPSAKWMSLSFHNRELLIAYPRFRPLFVVPPLWQPVSAEAMQRCIWEVESIFHVIDTIKLNPQIRT